MSDITWEGVLAQARQLPWLERQKLLRELSAEIEVNHETSVSNEKKPHPGLLPWKDRNREYDWLKVHAREYVGQWVALEGDQLVARGTSALEVLEAATASGIDRPLVLQVEDPDGPPFAGF